MKTEKVYIHTSIENGYAYHFPPFPPPPMEVRHYPGAKYNDDL